MEKLNQEQQELLRLTLTNLVKINNEVLPSIDEMEIPTLKEHTEKVSLLIHEILKEVKND